MASPRETRNQDDLCSRTQNEHDRYPNKWKERWENHRSTSCATNRYASRRTEGNWQVAGAFHGGVFQRATMAACKNTRGMKGRGLKRQQRETG